MSRLNRRTFVLGGLAVTGAVALPGRAGAALAYPFTLGVASGDPLPDGVVLWTRLAIAPLNADGQGGMPNRDVVVDWQVATDEAMTSLVAQGSVAARYADAHCVHVEVGGLEPDAEYFYRFRAEGHLSTVGRTRTAPAVDVPGRDLLIAVASCAHWENGLFTVYQRMAQDRPDLILHLGDYIYENAAGSGGVRSVAGGEPLYLADYRRRYAQYRTDPDLRAAHAAAPWLVVPDDHEVENNYAGFHRNDSSPVLTEQQFRDRRAAAYRAYYENQPLRRTSVPMGPNIQLYRRIRWGTLATFHLLDTRQFRDDQACGDGWKYCPIAGDPARSLPGMAQESWLLDGLAQHYATWDLIGQQVFFARSTDANGAGNMDAWDGYPASRDRLQKGWVQRGVRNPVVLTGDVHKSFANNLKANYDIPQSPIIGTELVTTSISSGGNGSGSTTIPRGAQNPHMRFCSDRRGYLRATITQTRIQADFRAVDQVTQPGAPAYTVRSFTIQDGHPGLNPA